MSSPNDPSPGPDPQKPSEGWVERMAKRSAGLGDDPQTTESRQTAKDASEMSRLWRLGGMGIQFAGVVLIFWLMGRGLDRLMGWEQRGTIGCLIVAVIGGTYLLIKEAMKENRR